jgi:hypothetical protein
MVSNYKIRKPKTKRGGGNKEGELVITPNSANIILEKLANIYIGDSNFKSKTKKKTRSALNNIKNTRDKTYKEIEEFKQRKKRAIIESNFVNTIIDDIKYLNREIKSTFRTIFKENNTN